MAAIFDIELGYPKTRIREDSIAHALSYPIYSFPQHQDALFQTEINSPKAPELIKTSEKLKTLKKGDVVMSLINPKAAIISKDYDGFILSPNFVKITPNSGLDPLYLSFLLNESDDIRSQLENSLQSSITIAKVRVSTLRDLKLPKLPDMEKQHMIGKTYWLSKMLKKKYTLKVELEDLKTTEILRRITNE